MGDVGIVTAKRWEKSLWKLLREMENANGDTPVGMADNKLEARVRIAWEQAHADVLAMDPDHA